MPTLTKPRVTARQTEKAVQELFNQLFKLYFTGVPHAAPLGTVTFPLVDLFFNQTQLPTPATRPQIHVVFTDLKARSQDWNATSKMMKQDGLFTIFVRCANAGSEGEKTDFLCRSVADNVKEIFETADDCYALARKGITHPKIVRGPQVLQATGYQARMMMLACGVRYFVPLP